MILYEIIEQKRIEVIKQKKIYNEQFLINNILPKNKRIFKEALIKSKMNLIAEVKKASPSKGVFKEDFNPVEIALAYEEAGASAISVLTDNKFFKGSINDLSLVKEKVKLPVLRKDFIIDHYQIYESRYIGADAILLITSILEEEQLNDYISLAKKLELDVLVEVHSYKDVEMALKCGAEIIGINNRNLQTFKTDISTTINLAKFIPNNCILVSESGINNGNEVKLLADNGVKAILVGEALVKSSNISLKIQELLKECIN